MMLFLLYDLIQHALLLRRTYAERRVTDLPGKCPSRRKCLMNPTGGICLHRSNDLGGREFRWKDCQDVNMIGWPVHQQRARIQFTKNPAQIGKHSSFEIRFESWLTVLCAENNVRQQIGECVCHILTPLRGLLRF